MRAHARVLQEELGPVGVVDERVDVAGVGLRLLEPRVAAALVRDAGAPDLRRVDRREQAECGERLARVPTPAQRRERIVVVEDFDDVAVAPADARAALGLDADEADQYVARPPEMS